MENNLDCGLLPSFARSCTEIRRGFFMPGIPPSLTLWLRGSPPAAPSVGSIAERITVIHLIRWEKRLREVNLGGKKRLFTAGGTTRERLYLAHQICQVSYAAS